MSIELTNKFRTLLSTTLVTFLVVVAHCATPLKCDLTEYKAHPGLTAAIEDGVLVVSWTGANGTELRTRFVISNGQPMIRELAVRARGNAWKTLGENLSPEYRMTSGVRRMSEQQAAPLRALGVAITPDVIEKNKWYAFWDAPLEIPGTHSGGATPHNIGLPRKPEEIRHATASFHSDTCSVKSDGDRIEITFPGLNMGIFSGSLRFTVYGGTNLIRMDAIARTEEPSVAYKYEAGLSGFSTDLM